jgi:hypothetical protein
MEGWRDGVMEGWSDGVIQGWRDRAMEGWSDGVGLGDGVGFEIRFSSLLWFREISR